MPALLEAARREYGVAIRKVLQDNGFGDVPRRGASILGAVDNHGASLREAAQGLGVGKDRARRVLGALLDRGYLERDHTGDVVVTDRGRAAAAQTRTAIAGVDAALAEQVGPEAVAATRAVLGALV